MHTGVPPMYVLSVDVTYFHFCLNAFLLSLCDCHSAIIRGVRDGPPVSLLTDYPVAQRCLSLAGVEQTD